MVFQDPMTSLDPTMTICLLYTSQGTCTARIPGYGGQIDVNISYVG